MNLLLDTQAWIWHYLGNPRLSTTARTAIGHSANTCRVSVASVWEVAIKAGLGKLQLGMSFDDFVQIAVTDAGIDVLPIEIRHASTVLGLPLHHRDPFDRMLAAQALTDNFTLVSTDAVFDQYGVPRLW